MPTLFAEDQHAALVASRNIFCRQKGCGFPGRSIRGRCASPHCRNPPLSRNGIVGARQDPDQPRPNYRTGATLPPRCEHIIEAGGASSCDRVEKEKGPVIASWNKAAVSFGAHGICGRGVAYQRRTCHSFEQDVKAVPDLQCAWLILLYCAAARAQITS